MDTHEIVENFPNNQIIKQVADGKAPMPTDPDARAVYEAQVEKYEDKQDARRPPGFQEIRLRKSEAVNSAYRQYGRA